MEENSKQTKAPVSHVLREWLVALLVAVAVALFITQVIIVNARVPTGSMKPTILEGDRVIGLRLAYLFSEPERGDIVIFRFPDDETQLYVKRIVGMPGEQVDIHGGNVYINGELLDGPAGGQSIAGEFGPYTVPDNHYFMMGDNRNSSLDSRYWNNTYLPRENIVGKGVLRLFPDPGLLE